MAFCLCPTSIQILTVSLLVQSSTWGSSTLKHQHVEIIWPYMAMIGAPTYVPPGVQKIPTCGALLHGEGQGAGGLSQRRPDRMWKWRIFSPRQIVSSEFIYERDLLNFWMFILNLWDDFDIFWKTSCSILRILRVMPQYATMPGRRSGCL